MHNPEKGGTRQWGSPALKPTDLSSIKGKIHYFHQIKENCFCLGSTSTYTVTMQGTEVELQHVNVEQIIH